MQLQFTPLIWIHFATALIAYAVSVYCWGLRPARGATTFALTAGSALFWTIGDALELVTLTPSAKMAAIRFSYVGITATIYFWSLFVIAYSRYERKVSRRTRVLLAVVPAVTLALVFSTPLHTLFYKGVELVPFGNLIIAEKSYGPAFWVFIGYSYVATLGGALMLIQAVVRYPHLYRGQALTMILAGMLPLTGNLLYLGILKDISPVDLTPLGFSLSGVFVAYSIRRYRFLDVMPVAHDLVFKNVKSAVAIIDVKGRILDANIAAQEILGKGRDETIGKTLFNVMPEHTALIEPFRHVMETRTEITIGEEGRVYELQIAPLEDRGGNAAGRVIMLYDITEQRRAVEERDRLISDLDAYARTVAHDLKLPVAAMLGLTGMLKAKKSLSDKERDELLNRVLINSQLMDDIIQSLLLLARIRQEADIPTEPFRTKEIVDAAMSRLEALIEQYKPEIKMPDQWPMAVGHAQWIDEVWANLISNAIKYGGEPPKIELGAERADSMIRFWVKDYGAGMTLEDQAELFTEFKRLDQHRSVVGHGLGLAIVRRIIERLGGEVKVESKVGEGSTFSFTLPSAEKKKKTGDEIDTKPLSGKRS